jgi:hypothetical protein
MSKPIDKEKEYIENLVIFAYLFIFLLSWYAKSFLFALVVVSGIITLLYGICSTICIYKGLKK